MLSRASSLREFQFTHPGGVRRVFFASDAAKTMVSIHAPGRGATCLRTFVHLLHDSFNSRTREGCDLSVLPVMCHSVLFQFTHPGGVRLAIADTLKAQEMGFNSRTREGCDGLHRHHQRLTTQFQFTHPGGVRLLEYDGKSYKRLFQFTHPGGVRQQYPQLELFAIGVSIHAPGRGATFGLVTGGLTYHVSIHAPGRGATVSTSTSISAQASFNSRTREGCDCTRPYIGDMCHVSIHAPGRGATRIEGQKVEPYKGFQFTHPGGVRQALAPRRVRRRRFQFTHPGGVRRHRHDTIACGQMFQFTHPGGVRRDSYAQMQASKPFQFTHPGGVRPE